MKKNFDITVIVPFYKRDSYALNIYKELDFQSTQNKIYTEVLFIDSYSRTSLESYLKEYKNGEKISYRILDVEDYVSKKRNKGISESKTNFIVTIDDDCIPSENFLIGHFNKLKEFQDKKVLICGKVKYSKKLCEKSNYFRFREEKHRKFDRKYHKDRKLNFHNIVVMNMSFSKDIVLHNNLKFNERYNAYGFEDIQYGIDAISKNFKIITCSSTITHQDSTKLNAYYTKLKSFAKSYYYLFYPTNKSLIFKSQNKIYENFKEQKILFFLAKFNDSINRNNFFARLFFFLIKSLIFYLIKFFIYYLNSTDKMKKIYSFTTYQLLVNMIFLESFFCEKNVNKSWTE